MRQRNTRHPSAYVSLEFSLPESWRSEESCMATAMRNTAGADSRPYGHIWRYAIRRVRNAFIASSRDLFAASTATMRLVMATTVFPCDRTMAAEPCKKSSGHRLFCIRRHPATRKTLSRCANAEPPTPGRLHRINRTITMRPPVFSVMQHPWGHECHPAYALGHS